MFSPLVASCHRRLARQILIKSLVAIDAGDRVRAHRLHIVEIEQHRRMALDRLQEIREAAEHVGAHHGDVFVGRNAEMVGPEPDQALDQVDLGVAGSIEASFGLAENDLLRQWWLLRGRIAIERQFGHLRSDIGFAARRRLFLLTRRQLLLGTALGAKFENLARRFGALTSD